MNRNLRSNDGPAPQPLRNGGASSVDEQAAAKLIEGYPPPPATQVTVQRIWQRVVSAPELQDSFDGSRLPRALLLAASLALCIAVVGFIVLRTPPRSKPSVMPVISPTTLASTAELAAARGGVFVASAAQRQGPGRWQPGQPLAEGQSVRTDSSGQAMLNIRGIASVLIAPGTEVAIDRLASGTYLRLARGSVVARVSKRPPGEPFVILAHGYSVKVVGTLFQVDQDASDRIVVSVREGVVEVGRPDGQSWRVLAGQRWSSTDSKQRGTSAIADPVKALLEDGLKGVTPVELVRELGALDLDGARGLVDEPSPALPPPNLGAQNVQDTPSRSHSSPAQAFEQRRANPGLGEPRASEPLPPPPLVLAASDPVAAPERRPGPHLSPAPISEAVSKPSEGTYADGLALERAGRLHAAAEDFIQAEKSDPAHAELALYALGRLRQHRLRDPQGALQAFETYRRAYPNGHLLAEVDLAVLEVEVAAGHRDQALAESERFLASHPASERTVEVHLLRGDLLRERGDCRSALAEYRQVNAAGFAEEALFETAYCQRKLGDASAARDSLRQYLQRYPAGTHLDEVAKALRQ